MHHIQRKILSKLAYAPYLSYAQMRPKGVESNHFAYHLAQLVKAGLVTKNDRQYSVTTAGQALADRASHAKMAARLQPHIITSICVTNQAGQQILFKHAFQPYLGLVGLPQGRLHFEESITEAAQRELAEKTGLTNIDLTHRGIVYVQANKKDGQTISKYLAHIFSGVSSAEPQILDTENGASFWADPKNLDPKECMPGFLRIEELLAKNKNLFFAELEAEELEI